ncbi:hypothetical protein ACFOY4_09865 [Actinomadura syzygii]|nr:hypothetical protein [Actinomadura syzygii]
MENRGRYRHATYLYRQAVDAGSIVALMDRPGGGSGPVISRVRSG